MPSPPPAVRCSWSRRASAPRAMAGASARRAAARRPARAARRRRARGSSRRSPRRRRRCGPRRSCRSTRSAATRAPNDSAISTVRSLEPVSTTIISETASRHDSRQAASISSSSRTIMQSEMLPAAGCVRARFATCSSEGRSARSAIATGERQRHAHGAAQTLARRLEVAAHVLGGGIEPLYGLEQPDRQRRLVQAVHRDADVVHDDRLVRLAREPRQRRAATSATAEASQSSAPSGFRSSSSRSQERLSTR